MIFWGVGGLGLDSCNFLDCARVGFFAFSGHSGSPHLLIDFDHHQNKSQYHDLLCLGEESEQDGAELCQAQHSLGYLPISLAKHILL